MQDQLWGIDQGLNIPLFLLHIEMHIYYMSLRRICEKKVRKGERDGGRSVGGEGGEEEEDVEGGGGGGGGDNGDNGAGRGKQERKD